PGGNGDLAEFLVISDVARLEEVCRQQGLLEPALEVDTTVVERRVKEAVGIESVDVQGLPQPVEEPLFRSRSRDSVLHLLDGLRAAAVFAREHVGAAFLRL